MLPARKQRLPHLEPARVPISMPRPYSVCHPTRSAQPGTPLAAWPQRSAKLPATSIYARDRSHEALPALLSSALYQIATTLKLILFSRTTRTTTIPGMESGEHSSRLPGPALQSPPQRPYPQQLGGTRIPNLWSTKHFLNIYSWRI